MTLRVNITGADIAASKAPPDLGALEAQYGLPPGVLAATSQVESGGNPNAVSSAGAVGQFQIMPAVAKNLGVDPRDPSSAADGAARLWQQNLAASGGDVSRAAMMYHGGPNTAIWGPKTHAYAGKIADAMASTGGGLSPDNPFAPGAGSGTATPNAPPALSPDNPFAPSPVVADGVGSPGIGQGNAGSAPPPQLGSQPGGATSASPFAPGSGLVGGGAVDTVGSGPSVGTGGSQPDPQAASSPRTFAGLGHALADYGTGLVGGAADAVGGATELIGHGTDALGLTQGGASRVAASRQSLAQAFAAHQFNPGTGAASIGNFVGNIVPTLPIGEIGILSRIPGVARAGVKVAEATASGTKAAGLARVLAAGGRIGDAALQGAAGGMVGGAPGSNVGGNAIAGALAGGAVGAAAPLAGRALNAVTSKSQALAKLLRPVPPPPVQDAAANAIQNNLPDPQSLAAAVLNGGDRRGLASNVTLTPHVKGLLAALQKQGVPLAPALREAEATAIGAQPLAADVTRDYAGQHLTREAAKATTPEAGALRAQILANNEAAHNAVTGLVRDYGGVPAQGEAMSAAQQSLADASDRARLGVTRLYKAADAAAGADAAKVTPTALTDFLNAPESRATISNEGGAFVSGLNKRLGILADTNGAIGAADLERLRQAANHAYDPMGGEVNHLAGGAKSAIDDAFDKLGDTSDAYKAARAAHKEWAQTYDIPGVSDLIARDAKGDFIGAANKVGNSLIRNSDDRGFENVVSQLKANGDQPALDKIKAEVIQHAYEAVTGAAPGEGGRTLLNGRRFLAELDKLGERKLSALFTPDELGQIATIGRGAMHVNEVIPGATNTSNTASTIGNMLAAAMAEPKSSVGGKLAMGGIKVGAHAAGQAIMPGVGGALMGHVVGEVGSHLGGAGRAKALGKAISAASTPALARSAAQERAAGLARALAAHKAGNSVARLAAPAGAVAGGHR